MPTIIPYNDFFFLLRYGLNKLWLWTFNKKKKKKKKFEYKILK